MMDTTRAESALCYLKAAAFAQQKIFRWHSDIVKDDFSVAFRGIVVSKHLHGSDDFDTVGVHGDQDHRLLFVTVGVVGVVLTHDYHDFTARVARARDVPFATVYNVLVAITNDAGLNISGIT